MRENICFYFMQTHALFILPLVLLWLNNTTATSLGHKLVVAKGGATNTCIDNERQALLDFKARLLEPDDLLSTWRPEEEDDCCKWSGVTCNNQTGHVTMLDLMCDYNYTGGVGGEISPSLLNLTYLNHLHLLFCSFHGTIPPFIGSMTHLTYLDLSQNEFIGTIPKSIGSLTGLTFLDLSENELVGTIPMSIGYLTNLRELNLAGNNFSGTITESIGNMTNLTTIDLRWNKFSGIIPRSIGYLTNLRELNIAGNNFSGTIPESIGNMTNLTTTDLSRNNFSGIIPRSIGSLTRLEYLGLSDNSFSGTIPRELGNLTNLLTLDLYSIGSCAVENLDWLSSLSSLTYLRMDGTSLAKANNWVNVIVSQVLWGVSRIE